MATTVKNLSEQKCMSLCINDIIAQLIIAHKKKQNIDLTKLKCQASNKYGLSFQPKLYDIINAIPPEYKTALLPQLKAKPIRTASGIAVVAVMCKPHRCPHINTTGNVCVYCPGGPDSDFEYSTQSYTGYEPTSMRAIRARYDPYIQARHRITQLQQLGHDVEKIEYIVMGGTFMSLPEDYRDYFIRNLHDALSGFTSRSVTEAVKMSERSKIKCIGITIETRPDYCLERHINDMLSYGCTRLEIGVQSVYEDVALDTNRGHTVKATCETFALAKEAGYKVVTHMMPDLPNVCYRRDVNQFHQLFSDPEFRPDGLKIYPTLVIRGTGLYELWKSGRYRSYAPGQLINLVSLILSLVPPWTRVYRVQRDIPMPLVTASAVESGNLRELCSARMEELGLACRDVRTREAGIKQLRRSHNKAKGGGGKMESNGIDKRGDDTETKVKDTDGGKKEDEFNLGQSVELVRRDYAANQGWETFLSYEDTETGLLRLRKCSEEKAFRPELKPKLLKDTSPSYNSCDPTLLAGVSMVRELHVYGSVVPIHAKDPLKFQHQGIGTLLMEEAERISRLEHGSYKIAVISGVGTRNYYRKLGYHLDGVYMSKILD